MERDVSTGKIPPGVDVLGVMDRANCGVCLASLDGTVIYVNKWFADRHGWTPEECVSRPISLFHSPEQTSLLRGIAERAAHGESFISVEVLHVRKSGETFPLSMNAFPIKGPSGTLELFAVTAVDLPRGGEAVDELRRSVQALGEAAHEARIGFWEYDRHSGRTIWSEETYRLFGRSPLDGAPSLKEYERLYRATDNEYRKIIRAALEKGERAETEFEVTLPGGVRRSYHGIINARRDVEGKVARLWGTVQDVTEKKYLERELRDSKTLLLQRNVEIAQKDLALQELIRQVRDSVRGPERAHPPVAEDFPSVPETLSALTPRELQVCLLAHRGMSSKEIAREMGISTKSVETHRTHIRRKLKLEGQNLVTSLKILFRHSRDRLGMPGEKEK